MSTPVRHKSLDTLPTFATDAELGAALLGSRSAEWPAMAAALERRGFPKIDRRFGGNTEAQRAGARLEDRRKVIGHTAGSAVTAEVYDRDALEARRRVARARLSQRGEQPRNEVRERAGNESENL